MNKEKNKNLIKRKDLVRIMSKSAARGLMCSGSDCEKFKLTYEFEYSRKGILKYTGWGITCVGTLIATLSSVVTLFSGVFLPLMSPEGSNFLETCHKVADVSSQIGLCSLIPAAIGTGISVAADVAINKDLKNKEKLSKALNLKETKKHKNI